MNASLTYLALKAGLMAQLVLGLRQAALVTLGRMLALRPQDPYALASRAHLLAEAGDRRGALADSEQLTRLPQVSAAHFFNHGFLLEADGQQEAAEASFKRALALDPQLDRAWFGLGLVLTRQGRLEEALKAFERNTQLQPMSPHGWYELARIHERRREPEEVARIIGHLQGFEPRVAARLAQETGISAKALATN